MCEAGNGVVGTMPSVEVCKERGAGEYSCGADGPCTQSPMGNCKGRCEDEVPRCKARCDDPSLRSCKGQCEDTGKYAPRPDGKAPMWEGDAGSCKNEPVQPLLQVGGARTLQGRWDEDTRSSSHAP